MTLLHRKPVTEGRTGIFICLIQTVSPESRTTSACCKVSATKYVFNK